MPPKRSTRSTTKAARPTSTQAYVSPSLLQSYTEAAAATRGKGRGRPRKTTAPANEFQQGLERHAVAREAQAEDVQIRRQIANVSKQELAQGYDVAGKKVPQADIERLGETLEKSMVESENYSKKNSNAKPMLAVYYGGDVGTYQDAISVEANIPLNQFITISPLDYLEGVEQYAQAVVKMSERFRRQAKSGVTTQMVRELTNLAMGYAETVGAPVTNRLLSRAMDDRKNIILAVDALGVVQPQRIEEIARQAKNAGYETMLFWPVADKAHIEVRLAQAFGKSTDEETGKKLRWDPKLMNELQQDFQDTLQTLMFSFHHTLVVQVNSGAREDAEVPVVVRMEISAQCSSALQNLPMYKKHQKFYDQVCDFNQDPGSIGRRPAKEIEESNRLRTALKVAAAGVLITGAVLLAIKLGLPGLVVAGAGQVLTGAANLGSAAYTGAANLGSAAYTGAANLGSAAYTGAANLGSAAYTGASNLGSSAWNAGVAFGKSAGQKIANVLPKGGGSFA